MANTKVKPIKTSLDELGPAPRSGLQPGDRIRLTFAASDIFLIRAGQAAAIEWRLDAHPDEFYVRSINYQKKGTLTFEIQIKETAKRLWTEKNIADLILSYNPKGLYLVLKNATVDFVQEAVKSDIVKWAVIVGVALLVLVVFMKVKLCSGSAFL